MWVTGNNENNHDLPIEGLRKGKEMILTLLVQDRGRVNSTAAGLQNDPTCESGKCAQPIKSLESQPSDDQLTELGWLERENTWYGL